MNRDLPQVLRGFPTASPPPAMPEPAPPPTCELCGRSGLELTKHHLIPKARHKKPRTRRTHPPQTLNTAIAMLCPPCHATVHHHLSEQELAEAFHTIDALRSHPEIAKFARWAAKQPVDRRVALRRPRR